MPPPRARSRIALAFLACLVALVWFQRPVQNPNENSRLAPVLAAFWNRTLQIDPYHAVRPTWTSDKSIREGHVYSDKAPGSSLLAAIGYAPVYAWERFTGREISYVAGKQAMTVAAVGIPLAAALAALFALVATALGARRAAGATAVALLATPLLPFGSTLFGHALAGALLFLAFALVRRATERPPPTRRRDLAGAGALLGLVAITEFPAAPAGLLVVAYGLHRLARRGELGRARTWVAPLLGGAPFLAALALWNWACFGSPFSIGYENLAVPGFRRLHESGLVGVRLPSLTTAYYVTLHPARGLFVSAPILLLAFPGLVAMARRGWKVEAALCLGVFLSFLLVNAGFPLWWGGYTYTARHLVPAVPFLVLPLAFLGGRWLWAAIPLVLPSAVQTLAAAAGDPFARDWALVRLILAARRTGDAVIAWGAWSFTGDVWPRLMARAPDGRWIGFSPNWGRLLGLTGPASVLAMVFASLALLAAAGRSAGTRVLRRPKERPALATREARQGAT
ncbi:MAG TPA: hypothetical protein VEB43_11740 [Anaeromyxobacter sp.]|nr:hypothetical protein [Anaeromyxobacter sp.]